MKNKLIGDYFTDPPHAHHHHHQPYYNPLATNGSSSHSSSTNVSHAPPPPPPPSLPSQQQQPPQSSSSVILYSINPNNSAQTQPTTTTTSSGGVPLPLSIASSSDSSQQVTTPMTPRRVTLEWRGEYPSVDTSLLQPLTAAAELNSWLLDEFPDIDFNIPPPDYWCTISYFEGDTQVGDLFKVRSQYNSVVVDGLFDSTREDRFCVGALTNVNRTSSSEKARMHIGKGVQLEQMLDGSIYVRNLSEQHVFFESYYLDRESGRDAYDAPHKIYPISHIKVFSFKECMRCLKKGAQDYLKQQQQLQLGGGASSSATGSSSSSTVNGSNGGTASGSTTGGGATGASGTNGASSPGGGVNVDDLRKMCRLRFSFVKGWGPDYPRKAILETPCWCEIQLNRPLQFLDQLINSLSVHLSNNR